MNYIDKIRVAAARGWFRVCCSRENELKNMDVIPTRGHMSYIDEIVNEINKKLTHGCEIAVFKAFLRQKIQETIEKCKSVAEDFAKDSFDEHEASTCRAIASTIRKIGD